MLPATTTRVAAHTPRRLNDAIRRKTERNLFSYGHDRNRIDARLRQLDREWDIERALEANAASVMLVGLALAVAVDRRFLALPAAVAGFLLQHALQGWCPPVPAMRRLGIRTAAEIGHERYALKALRGDFARLADAAGPRDRAETALRAAKA